jgi:hypothetical protein
MVFAMPLWMQHTFVLVVVAVAAFVLLRQLIATLRGRGNKLGSCCAKGCDPHPKPQSPGERLVFLPSESLVRSRRS